MVLLETEKGKNKGGKGTGDSFKLEFGWTLEWFSKCISGWRDGIKEPSCLVSGLGRNTCCQWFVSDMADYTRKKQQWKETNLVYITSKVRFIIKYLKVIQYVLLAQVTGVYWGLWKEWSSWIFQLNRVPVCGKSNQALGHTCSRLPPCSRNELGYSICLQCWSDMSKDCIWLCCFLLIVSYLICGVSERWGQEGSNPSLKNKLHI